MGNLYNEFKQRSNADRVVDYIEEKLKKKPNRIIAYVELTKRMLKDKSFKHAYNLLSEGIKKNPDTAVLLMEMGKLKYITQAYGDAAESFASALKFKDAKKVETLYNLGLCYLQIGRSEESVTHLR